MRKVYIEISRTCYKGCYYCYNTKKIASDLKPDIQKIINSVIKLSAEDKNLNLIFSGGEPIYNLEGIKSITKELSGMGLKIKSTIITNTEFLTKDLVDFINSNRPYLVLSFNKMTPKILKDINKLLPKDRILIRFTITPENSKNILSEIAATLSLKYLIGISPAFGIPWDDKSLKILSTLYTKLALQKNSNYIYDFAKLQYTSANNHRECPSIQKSNAIDIFGNIYPCHRAINFPDKEIQQGRFKPGCESCPAYRFCTPCVFKDIPGDGCKIRIAISSVYNALYYRWRYRMKKKIRIYYKGKKYEVPETILKKYTKMKKSTSKKNSRNFYELGESDCY
ncbi:MAG: radical SAM protein [Deltaproteobacteria bacterium]|nr:radical SAM protein [Deltaproteobacteria bacterium]